ncbi:MAG: translation initiation factor IF-3 [Clostridiales bacterium]|nr:translation initiation factor IF-3 [Clostridiales bacterium]
MKELQINEQIRDKEVRLIGADGSQLGIFSAYNAQKIADEAHLDLVKISPNAVPPVCKVMDYGKYRYEQSKKEKEAKKNQKIVELKEIRLSMTIDDGDLNTKAKTAAKFLKEGNKVKVSLRMRGRQMVYVNEGIAVVLKFAELLNEVAVIEKKPVAEGRFISMVIAPVGTKATTHTKQTLNGGNKDA